MCPQAACCACYCRGLQAHAPCQQLQRLRICWNAQATPPRSRRRSRGWRTQRSRGRRRGGQAEQRPLRRLEPCLPGGGKVRMRGRKRVSSGSSGMLSPTGGRAASTAAAESSSTRGLACWRPAAARWPPRAEGALTPCCARGSRASVQRRRARPARSARRSCPEAGLGTRRQARAAGAAAAACRGGAGCGAHAHAAVSARGGRPSRMPGVRRWVVQAASQRACKGVHARAGLRAPWRRQRRSVLARAPCGSFERRPCGCAPIAPGEACDNGDARVGGDRLQRRALVKDGA